MVTEATLTSVSDSANVWFIPDNFDRENDTYRKLVGFQSGLSDPKRLWLSVSNTAILMFGNAPMNVPHDKFLDPRVLNAMIRLGELGGDRDDEFVWGVYRSCNQVALILGDDGEEMIRTANAIRAMLCRMDNYCDT